MIAYKYRHPATGQLFVTQPVTQRWLEAWGYDKAPHALHFSAATVPGTHTYRPELEALLDPGGAIQAKAVFDVDGVPTVCFIEDDGRLAANPPALDRIRQKIWNQNLISVMLVVDDQRALATPVIRGEFRPEVVSWREARDTGMQSRADMQSGGLFVRHAEWFNPSARVDQDLLRNLGQIVNDFTDTYSVNKLDAQYLMAQVLFVSYLEHRNIVSDVYRSKHQVDRLEHLVQVGNRRGITKLLNRLDADFNGDLLKPDTQGESLWQRLPDQALERLKEFLLRTDLESGQTSLYWGYDFRYIPVELISGIYESFLSEEKTDVGAYYTPRHLANLAVEQAFAHSKDLLSEKVYDGACGSGILLTTAYRRMLAYAEAKAKRLLDFRERSALLQEHIFGSDLNESACRVTAFSLYLSMLERLQPADIAALQENDNIKLPSLKKKNIWGGTEYGDFFSVSNPLAAAHTCTIFLSNPPWVEPAKDCWLSSDQWAKSVRVKVPRRQTAGAFMLRALDSVVPGGRLCLILPISVLAAPTSSEFLKTWLDRCRLDTLINFGDLRKLLFNSARQPCVVAVLTPREEKAIGKISGQETFQYWVPKADVSFAFGRLTLHASDRHEVQTQAVRNGNQLLTTLFWGTPWDVAMITRLRLLGTLDDLIGNDPNEDGLFPKPSRRNVDKKSWRSRKGFHMKDASVEIPDSSKPLWRMAYLNAKRFEVNGPVLDPAILSEFPRDKHPTVAKLSTSLMRVFKGPRIVFTDGISKDRSIRAAFSNVPFCFSSSMGVISGGDEDLLRFVAAYLHSDLVRYLLMLTAYQVNFERERVTLADIRRLPFLVPNRHANPKRAWGIVKKVASITRQLERSHSLLRQKYNGRDCEALLAEYFGLSQRETTRIHEVSQVIAPNLQPNTYAGLKTGLQSRPTPEQIARYTRELVAELKAWRYARGGKGTFRVNTTLGSENTCGPVGIVRLDVNRTGKEGKSNIGEVAVGNQAVRTVLQSLSAHDLLPLKIQENLYLATDVVIRHQDSLYLIKPLVQRLWLCAEAHRDAERIVRSVLSSGFDSGMEAKG